MHKSSPPSSTAVYSKIDINIVTVHETPVDRRVLTFFNDKKETRNQVFSTRVFYDNRHGHKTNVVPAREHRGCIRKLLTTV